MNPVPAQREYFLDSIRAWLMLLGIPFHISLIYSSHTWHVNSAEPSLWLTLFNDFIHSFRMQVFFVISGYFSYMLFTLSLEKMVESTCRTCRYPDVNSHPPTDIAAIYYAAIRQRKAESWPGLSLYDKYNTLAWELISHLWFLLVLVVMTTLCVWIFKRIRNNLENSDKTNKKFSMVKLSVIFLCLGIGYAVIRRTIFIVYPPILSNGMFNFIVMQTLFYLPFFILGALAFIFPHLKALFTTPSRGCTFAAALAFVAYLLNQRYGSGDAWMYETESVITMVLGLWMVNVVFSFGHRLLNFQSARVTYFVNASLFIYLVHHPLTLFFGAYITPHITSNWLGFLCGLIFVVGIAIILYEIHLRIPLLKFLFSGKPVVKRENDKAPAR